MRLFVSVALAALLLGCSAPDRPTPTLSDEELTSPEAFVRSVRIGNTTYLYARRRDDPSLFDVRVSGNRRATEQGLLDAVSLAYSCTSLRVIGMNRNRTAGRIKGAACKENPYLTQ